MFGFEKLQVSTKRIATFYVYFQFPNTFVFYSAFFYFVGGGVNL